LAVAAGAWGQGESAPAVPAPAAPAATASAARVKADLAKIAERTKAYAAGQTTESLSANPKYALAMLEAEKARMLWTMYRPGELRDKMLLADLAAARQAIGDAEQGRPPDADRRGLIEKAYLADNDLSPQPYLVYVPKSYQPGKPCGLYVFCHGYAYDLNKVNWIDMMFSDVLGELCEELGMIAALPFGRSNTEFMGVGEVDVLRVIDLVQRDYSIDPAGVFLSGGSMGGSGTYTIAAHHPHRFAGIVVIAGRANYYLWKNIRPNDMVPFKRIQTDIDYAQAFPMNLSNMRTFIFHGGSDSLLNVEQSRQFHRTLKAQGCDARYREFPGMDHWIWGDVFSFRELKDWLAKTRRDPYPKHVRFRTYSLKYDRAYWVRIDRIARWGEPAEIDAVMLSDATVGLRCTNVGAVTLDLPPEFMGGRPLRVICNGRPTTVEKSNPGYTVQLTPLPKGKLRKTRGICGPVREAHASRFAFVYGTQKNASEVANTALRAARQWINFAAGRAVLVADKDVSKEHVRDCNLVLFGGPEENAYVRKIAAELPIEIDKEGFGVGAKRFSRAESSLLMIYPNPENPKRYVALNVGRLWGMSLSRNHVWDFVPDFIVFGRGQDSDGTDRYQCAGYFDSDWQLSPATTWTRELVIGH